MSGKMLVVRSIRSDTSFSPFTDSLATTKELGLKVLALIALPAVMVRAAAALKGVSVGVGGGGSVTIGVGVKS